MPELNADEFDVLTFDCYGTLVDWESAIIEYLQKVLLSHDVHVFNGTILEFYAEWEPLEQNAGGIYREVLGRVLQRYGSRLGFTATPEETEGFVDAITASQPYADTNAAITRLASKYKLGIISNTDVDLIATTLAALPVQFDHVHTAQELGAYKPDLKAVSTAFEKIASGNKRILHIAQSRYHDIQPATELNIPTVWINRQSDHGSAAQSVDATPTWEFEDLEQLVSSLKLADA